MQNHNPKKMIPFVKSKMIFIIISALVMGFSIYIWAQKGLNYGVDFSGGYKLVYEFKQPTSDGEIRNILEPLLLGDIQVVRFGSLDENSFMIKTKIIEGREITHEITKVFKEKWGEDSVELLSEESVGPRVGADLRKRGLFALIVTWALILLYIGIRFNFLFSPGAVAALIHDVIITIGFFAFFGKEFSLPTLAALLTIVGYSVNDTIILYDRIRENLHKLPPNKPQEEVVNISINETLSRTIITSLTVLFVVVVLFFWGGAVLHDFAFALIVGVIAGTYSTIFIASPVYLLFHRLFPHKGIIRRAAVK